MENKPYKTIGNWEIYHVTTPGILNYRLGAKRKKSIWEKIQDEIAPLDLVSKKEETTIDVVLDKRFGHTEKQAIDLLEKEIEEKINKFEQSWKTCRRSERTTIKQSFQGEENPVAVDFKRAEKINFIRLFDIGWVEISAVKEDPYSLGAVPYHEITLDSGEMLKINNDEIWLATPNGQRLEKEFGIKSLRFFEPKDQCKYCFEIEPAREMLSDLADICRAYKDNIVHDQFCWGQYSIWVQQKLGHSPAQDCDLDDGELFKPCIPYPPAILKKNNEQRILA